jgi:hypothetical protein
MELFSYDHFLISDVYNNDNEYKARIISEAFLDGYVSFYGTNNILFYRGKDILRFSKELFGDKFNLKLQDVIDPFNCADYTDDGGYYNCSSLYKYDEEHDMYYACDKLATDIFMEDRHFREARFVNYKKNNNQYIVTYKIIFDQPIDGLVTTNDKNIYTSHYIVDIKNNFISPLARTRVYEDNEELDSEELDDVVIDDAYWKKYWKKITSVSLIYEIEDKHLILTEIKY